MPRQFRTTPGSLLAAVIDADGDKATRGALGCGGHPYWDRFRVGVHLAAAMAMTHLSAAEANLRDDC
jgi:hypothetical protein